MFQNIKTSNNRHMVKRIMVGTTTFASTVANFFTGLCFGATGSLLGVAAVAVTQSLELLADNRQLMDQLGNYIHDLNFTNFTAIQEKKNYIEVHDVHISLFALLFGLLSATFSLTIGIFLAFLTYALVIKKAKMGKALFLAGSVSLIGVTVTGYVLGLALEHFLLITLKIRQIISFLISCMSAIAALATIQSTEQLILFLFKFLWEHKAWLLMPFAAFTVFLLSNFGKWKLILANTLFPVNLNLKDLEKSLFPKQATLTIPLMLIIVDAFNMVGQPIINLQSPQTSTNPSSVVQAIFIGILATHLLTVAVGMSLFLSWHRSDAGKICATAAGSGVAVLGIIKLALPSMGPGPSIGAVIGVTGVIGVSLSAGRTATDQYCKLPDTYGLVGRVGFAVGAGVGAFLFSCAHSGLSGVFMGLCATTVAVGLYLKEVDVFLQQKCQSHKCTYVTVIIVYLICSLVFVIIYTHLTLSPFVHRVLSVVFLVLCASRIPVGLCLKHLVSNFSFKITFIFCALLIIIDSSLYDLVFKVHLIKPAYHPAVLYASLLFHL